MLMYQAGGVIEQKALAEANTRIGRAMQRVEGVTGAKFPVTPLAMAATGGAGATLMASGFVLADLKLDRAVVSALLTDLRPAPEEEE
jgi:hypothetical protein